MREELQVHSQERSGGGSKHLEYFLSLNFSAEDYKKMEKRTGRPHMSTVVNLRVYISKSFLKIE